MAALLLRETLLLPVARPLVVDHPRAERLGERLRPVRRTRIDHDQIVGQVAHGTDRGADPVRLVARDDEDGEREHGGVEAWVRPVQPSQPGMRSRAMSASTSCLGRTTAASDPRTSTSGTRGRVL